MSGPTCGLDPRQVLEQVVRPALASLGGQYDSLAAEQLVMGTGAQESGGFRWLRQRPSGPALGLFQLEPATYRDIWGRWLKTREKLRDALLALAVRGPQLQPGDVMPAVEVWPPVEQLCGNLCFAAAMCRVFYLRVPPELPHAGDVVGMANYWKTHYNTRLGKGKPPEFVNAYNRFVAPLYAA